MCQQDQPNNKMNQKKFNIRTQCPVCSTGGNLQTLFNISYDNEVLKKYIDDFYSRQGGVFDYSVIKNNEYQLIFCNNCRLLFQKEIPDSDLMFELYEKYINPEIKQNELSDNNKYSEEYFSLLRNEIKFLKSHCFQKSEKIKFLDYGMGWGLLCNEAQRQGMLAYGTELSPARIAYAEKTGITVIDINSIPDSFFDIINLSDVLEHVADPMDTVETLVKKIKPQGLLRLSVPGNPNILSNIKKFRGVVFNDWRFNCVAPLEHINCFHYETLQYMSKKTGLSLIGSLDFINPAASIKNPISRFKYIIKKHVLKNKYLKKSTNLVFRYL